MPGHGPSLAGKLKFIGEAADTGAGKERKALRYSIAGPNVGDYVATVDANGHAAITDPGTRSGGDAILAYLDL